MHSFHRILAVAILCLAAGACVVQAAPDKAELEQAERQIRLQWQYNPKLRYHTLFYKGTLQECMAGSKRFYAQNVRTLQGNKWIPVHELPLETLVFRGERMGFKQGKTKGGAGYFFCTPKTGELVAYLLMK